MHLALLVPRFSEPERPIYMKKQKKNARYSRYAFDHDQVTWDAEAIGAVCTTLYFLYSPGTGITRSSTQKRRDLACKIL
jgi:hypothetical protein